MTSRTARRSRGGTSGSSHDDLLSGGRLVVHVVGVVTAIGSVEVLKAATPPGRTLLATALEGCCAGAGGSTLVSVATPKTQRTSTDLAGHLDALPPARREVAQQVADLFTSATGEPAVLWGSIVGYGTTTTTSSGRPHEWPAVGFAVRGTRFALYGLRSGPDAEELLGRLGPHEAAVSCVYLKGLRDVDVDVLTELVRLGHSRAAV